MLRGTSVVLGRPLNGAKPVGLFIVELKLGGRETMRTPGGVS